jgi:hypothetical protein
MDRKVAAILEGELNMKSFIISFLAHISHDSKNAANSASLAVITRKRRLASRCRKSCCLAETKGGGVAWLRKIIVVTLLIWHVEN